MRAETMSLVFCFSALVFSPFLMAADDCGHMSTDIQPMTKQEMDSFSNGLTFVRHESGLCFAVKVFCVHGGCVQEFDDVPCDVVAKWLPPLEQPACPAPPQQSCTSDVWGRCVLKK